MSNLHLGFEFDNKPEKETFLNPLHLEDTTKNFNGNNLPLYDDSDIMWLYDN